MATKRIEAEDYGHPPEWPDSEEERYQATLEAIAEADASKLIPHEKIEAWIESLGTDRPLPPPTA